MNNGVVHKRVEGETYTDCNEKPSSVDNCILEHPSGYKRENPSKYLEPFGNCVLCDDCWDTYTEIPADDNQ